MFGRRQPLTFLHQLRQSLWPASGWGRALQYVYHRLLRSKESHHALALGVAVGVFASMTPFIGFHLILALGIAFLARASLLGAAIGTIIGNPFTFPLIWTVTYRIGIAVLGLDGAMGGELNLSDISPMTKFYEQFWLTLVPMLVGALLLGLLLAGVAYVGVLGGLEIYKNRRSRRRKD